MKTLLKNLNHLKQMKIRNLSDNKQSDWQEF